MLIDKDEILKAYNFRHACKVFDEEKKISDEDFNFLLETFRLSPSSFGMEPWRLLVIDNDELKARLKPHCWNQAQITSSSHLVVVVTKTALVEDDSYIEKMFARRDLDRDATKGYIEKFKGYIKELVMGFATKYMYKKSLQDAAVFEWCARQTYIASANMTTSAAMIGIDSCFIEGFKKDGVEKELDIDTKKEDVALILTFGYRVNPQPKKFRLDLDEVVERRV